jgi:hypothetical protein
LIERRLAKAKVAGLNPVSRSIFPTLKKVAEPRAPHALSIQWIHQSRLKWRRLSPPFAFFLSLACSWLVLNPHVFEFFRGAAFVATDAQLFDFVSEAD